ncbi:substrate-binding periplasmic protein [Lacibacterium aquatile]|uniref:Substrate-binding periplasmic protein n=1 Tax=Lacibacterium aquatile TaxID=1168082 RepID=A0ABW5DWT6_9PROT
MTAFRIAFATALALVYALPVFAQDKVAKLTSLEWPPYSGAALKDGGATVAVARAAFEAVGWKIEVKFVPWKRAVEMAKQGDDGTVGYFPEYFDAEASDFNFSVSMGNSPLGLVQPADKPVVWSSIADLKGAQPIGVVDGYLNTPEFDAAVASGTLKVDTVSDDTLNVKKVAAGRIKAAVIDQHVLGWYLKNDASLKGLADRVAFNEKPLAIKTLHIAFGKNARADAARAALEAGLEKIEIDRIVNDHFVASLTRRGAILLASR